MQKASVEGAGQTQVPDPLPNVLLVEQVDESTGCFGFFLYWGLKLGSHTELHLQTGLFVCLFTLVCFGGGGLVCFVLFFKTESC